MCFLFSNSRFIFLPCKSSKLKLVTLHAENSKESGMEHCMRLRYRFPSYYMSLSVYSAWLVGVFRYFSVQVWAIGWNFHRMILWWYYFEKLRGPSRFRISAHLFQPTYTLSIHLGPLTFGPFISAHIHSAHSFGPNFRLGSFKLPHWPSAHLPFTQSPRFNLNVYLETADCTWMIPFALFGCKRSWYK